MREAYPLRIAGRHDRASRWRRENRLTKLPQLWTSLKSSLWFTPGLMVLASVVMAATLIEMETLLGDGAVQRWPRLFGAGAEGSRSVLTAIATSMITVAGVVFSITIVALSLAASQYSSRVLRNFMNDRAVQLVLGAFVGIFTYCILVLRTIRSGEEDSFVPSVAVFFALVLAFVGIALFVYFIHHIASRIQAAHILGAIHRETAAAVDRLFPEELGEDQADESSPEQHGDLPELSQVVNARRSGYLQTVDSDALLKFARERGLVIEMAHGVGDFVIEGTPLARVRGSGEADPREAARRLEGAFALNQQRTIEQDAAFGIRQIVDMAIKALSPGVNDTTTAVMCLDHLSALLVQLSGRRFPSALRYEGGRLRVIARAPSFSGLADEAFDQIRQNGEGNVAVLRRMLDVLSLLAGYANHRSRRLVLLRHAEAVAETISRSIRSPVDGESLEADARKVIDRLSERRSGGPELPLKAGFRTEKRSGPPGRR